jgi:hypothetical protein
MRDPWAWAGLSGSSPRDTRHSAGFSGPGTLTLADVSTWGYLNPVPSDIGALIDIAQGSTAPTDAEDTLGRLIAGNGFGGGVSVGLGWSGRGLGAGLTFVSDALATGTSYSDASTNVRNQANAVFGMAWPLVLGPVKFSFGADIRAFYRIDSSGTWLFADLASAFFSGQGMSAEIAALSMNGGYGIAMDTGAIVTLGPLSAGVMVRDYGYKFYMGTSTVGGILDSGDLPLNGTNVYALAPIYSAGLGLNFRNGGPMTSSFYVEADDPMNFLAQAKLNLETSMELLHVGAELKFFNFLAFRAGFNQGLLSFGAGMDLAIIEIDAAVFSEKTADVMEGPGRSGLSLQAAIRF